MIASGQVQKAQVVYRDQGGKTTVYYGYYTRRNHREQETVEVAIKEMTMRPEEVGGLMQELLIQSKLEDCGSICKLYGYFIEQSTISIISEWLAHDLDQDVKRRQNPPCFYSESQLLSMLQQVVSALVFAKSKVPSTQNIAHRDIKPQNILLVRADGEGVKLVDFGSGSLVDGKQQKLTGTPLYMSPEQIPVFAQFKQTGMLPDTMYDDYLSDVYALGVTFLHLCLLEPPVQLLLDRHNSMPTYLARIQVQYPTMYYYLYYMLVADPAQRYTLDALHLSLSHSEATPTGDENPAPQSYPGQMQAGGQQEDGVYGDGRQASHRYSGSAAPVEAVLPSQSEYQQSPASIPSDLSLVSNSPPFSYAQYPASTQASYEPSYAAAPQAAAISADDYYFPCFVTLEAFDPFSNTKFSKMPREKKLEYLRSIFAAPQSASEITTKVSQVRSFGIEQSIHCGVFFPCDNCHQHYALEQYTDVGCKEHAFVCTECLPAHRDCLSVFKW